MVRRFSSYRVKKRKKKIFVFSIIIITIFALLDLQVRPLIKSIAENQAKISANNIINDEVLRELSNKSSYYSELVSIKTDNNGKILAVTTDSQKVNVLKSSVSSIIQREMPSSNPQKVAVPLGTLTGVELLTGRGPLINMKVSIPGTVSTDIKSEFVQAGINQTKHQIYISVKTQVNALIPGFPINTTVETSILVSEIVIVGDVLNVYADVNKSGTAAIAGLSQMEQN